MADVTVDIKLDHGAVRKILQAGGNLTAGAADRIAAEAGHGHGVRTDVGRNRARSAVITETMGARRREATEGTLSKALDAGR